MSDFLKSSSDKLNQIVNDSTNFESMREQMKDELARDGVITRDQASLLYGVRLNLDYQPEERPTVAATAPAVPAPQTCVRVVYPRGNNRFEIYGASEAELDLKEQQIRSMFAR